MAFKFLKLMIIKKYSTRKKNFWTKKYSYFFSKKVEIAINLKLKYYNIFNFINFNNKYPIK